MTEVLAVSVEGRTFVPEDKMPCSFWDRMSGTKASARFGFPEDPDQNVGHVASDGSEWVWRGDEWVQVLGAVDVPVLQAEIRELREALGSLESERDAAKKEMRAFARKWLADRLRAEKAELPAPDVNDPTHLRFAAKVGELLHYGALSALADAGLLNTEAGGVQVRDRDTTEELT